MANFVPVTPGQEVRFLKGHLKGKVRKCPSLKTLEKYAWDGVAKTPCGCRVEPDGECQHGYKSWLIYAGVM